MCECACVSVCGAGAHMLSIYLIVTTLHINKKKKNHVTVPDYNNPTVLSPCLSLSPCGQCNVRHFLSNNTHYWPQLCCLAYTKWLSSLLLFYCDYILVTHGESCRLMFLFLLTSAALQISVISWHCVMTSKNTFIWLSFVNNLVRLALEQLHFTTEKCGISRH